MDIPRKNAARNRRIRRIGIGVIALGLIALTTVGLSRLKPAPPTVDVPVWIDTVKRGEMYRQVRGLGRLVPEEIRWIPAVTQGRVEKRLVLPGTVVKADTVLMELSNPEVIREYTDAEHQLRAGESELKNLEVSLQTQYLTQQAAAAAVQAEFLQAKAQLESDEALAKNGLIPELNLKVSRTRADGLATRNEIEKKRLAMHSETAKAQLDVQQARVEQLRALFDLRRSQLDALRVRAGVDGVLQDLPVQVGQQVTPGTNLARVANPTKLKAELQIAETQAKDVALGQIASIDTRNGVIPGRVMRKDPSAREGTVTVDVALEGDLPKGAVPDLSVDGTIELERLLDVIYVGRPAFGQEKSTITLFKVEPDGRHANRVQVKLGRSSVNLVEILEGLQPNDQVILSDMQRWDAVERIRLR